VQQRPEEGHYGSFIGSRSFTGLLEEAEMDRLANRYDGTPLRRALTKAGIADRPRLALEEGRYKGFLEMHIEQGTNLERQGQQVGVVTGIVAIWQYRIVLEGQQDHAGGTTMAERRDAGLAAVRLLAWLDAEFPRHCGERTVWTTGRITLEPGAPSIIPGRAEILFQFRDISAEVLDRLDGVLRRAVQESNRCGRCTATLEVVSQSAPALCDPGLQDALAGAAEALVPDGWRRMPSGARRAVSGAQDAGRDAVRALDRRRQPPLGRGHQARGPRDGPARARRRRTALPGRLREHDGLPYRMRELERPTYVRLT
jgi:N-carbamoyl-L-amino-acid hydrolase